MGRGRAKAKQTKVARQLKYSTTGTDLDRLRAELSGDSDGGTLSTAPTTTEAADDLEDDDPYAAYTDDEDDEDEAQHTG